MNKKYTIEEIKSKEIIIKVRTQAELDKLVELFGGWHIYEGEEKAEYVEAIQFNVGDNTLYSIDVRYTIDRLPNTKVITIDDISFEEEIK